MLFDPVILLLEIYPKTWSGWGTHVNPWLIHVNVRQKPLQYCKVISLQLIEINGKKKKKVEGRLISKKFITMQWNITQSGKIVFESDALIWTHAESDALIWTHVSACVSNFILILKLPYSQDHWSPNILLFPKQCLIKAQLLSQSELWLLTLKNVRDTQVWS